MSQQNIIDNLHPFNKTNNLFYFIYIVISHVGKVQASRCFEIQGHISSYEEEWFRLYNYLLFRIIISD